MTDDSGSSLTPFGKIFTFLLVAGLVALGVGSTLLLQGLSTIRDCEDRVGHRPNHDEIEQCIKDGL